MILIRKLLVSVALASLVVGCSPGESNGTSTVGEPETSVTLTVETVEEAYIWGLPIIAMYRFTDVMQAHKLGFNRLVHSRKVVEPGEIGGAPNRDTLYSFAWLDLNDEPLVISLPDFGDRYFVWQITDMYAHNFHNVGSHLTEGSKENYRSGYQFMLAAPDWEGETPDGMDLVRSTVDVVNILYRIAIKNSAELAVVNGLQDETHVVPLSKWVEGVRESSPNTPRNVIPVYRDVIAYGTGVTGKDQRINGFFSMLEDALEVNTPYTEWDRAMVDGVLADMGVQPGGSFDFDTLDSETQAIILDGQEKAFDRLMAHSVASFGTRMNGWQLIPANQGNWGDHFMDRAYATYIGGMVPVATNSTYALSYVDAEGNKLTGHNSYRMIIPADAMPPVTSFWSVTVYEAGTFDLYPNEAGLYAVGPNHPGTVYKDDGAVEIIFSHTRPENLGDANWLPIPETSLFAEVRFYAPMPEVMSLEYDIPSIERID
jgi:hypothetical protein